MSKFEYKHTCPDIDASIILAENCINQHITSFIELHLGLISRQKSEDLAKEFTAELCSEINSCFEDVRTCNSNMRDEADRQIASWVEDLDDAEYKVKNLEMECSRLGDIIQDLKSEIEDLKQEVEDLNTQLEDVS